LGQRFRVAGDHGEGKLTRCDRSDHAAGHLGPDAAHGQEQLEQADILLGGETIQRKNVLTDIKMRIGRDLLADRTKAVEQRRSRLQAVANALGFEDQAVDGLGHQLALDVCIHY